MSRFYVRIVLSKSTDTWPRHCFDTEPSTVNKVRGISQNHWTNRFNSMLNANDQFQDGYDSILEHLNILGGVLQDYSPPSCDYLLLL